MHCTPYDFSVKASIAVTHKSDLILSAKTFSGNPYDDHILYEQPEQTRMLLKNTGSTPKQVIADLAFRIIVDDKKLHRGSRSSVD